MGGIVAPIAATKSVNIAFVAVLNAPGLPFKEYRLVQAELILKAVDEKINPGSAILRKSTEIALAEEKRMVELATSEVPDAEIAESLRRDRGGMSLSRADQMFLANFTGQLSRSLLKTDPSDFWKCVKVPVLALGGESDGIVSARLNLPPIEQALRRGGCPSFIVTSVPEHNHAMGRYPDDFTPVLVSHDTKDLKVIDVVADWIKNPSGDAQKIRNGIYATTQPESK